MTFQVLRTQVGPDFEQEVEAFRLAKIAHTKTTNVPAPTAAAHIEAAVQRVPRDGMADDFVADFEVIEEPLAEKKARIIRSLEEKRAREMDEIMTPERLNLLMTEARQDPAASERLEAVFKARHDVELEHARRLMRIEDLTEQEIEAPEWAALLPD